MPDTFEVGPRAYRLAALAAKGLPTAVTAPAASLLGLAFAQAMRDRRTTVERHLRRVKGPMSEIAARRATQAAFDFYARYWLESFRLPGLSREDVEADYSIDGYGHVLDGLRAGNGVILALPHLGGWEWAGRWAVDQGVRMTVIVEPLADRETFEWFVSFRRSLGMTVVPLGPDAGTASMRALKNNEVLALLCDRDIAGGGIEVEFFGERTTLPAGPATLALRTGAPIVPTAVYFTGRHGHRGVVRPPLALERTGRLRDDVARVTQLIAAALEKLIRVAPEQWHLFQPNWPSDPGYGEEQGKRG